MSTFDIRDNKESWKGNHPRSWMTQTSINSDAVSGWAGLALAHPDLGFQLTLFQPGEVDYAHHITACPPGFENLMASLIIKKGRKGTFVLKIKSLFCTPEMPLGFQIRVGKQ